jgi:hypothetical protein
MRYIKYTAMAQDAMPTVAVVTLTTVRRCLSWSLGEARVHKPMSRRQTDAATKKRRLRFRYSDQSGFIGDARQ